MKISSTLLALTLLAALIWLYMESQEIAFLMAIILVVTGMIMWLPGGILFAFLIVLYFGAWLQVIEKRMQGTHPEFIHTGDTHE